MKASIVATFVAALALFSANSYASVISVGTPVDSSGSAVASGNVGSDGTIRFYIPLSGGYAGTFGVGGVGLSSGGFNGAGGAGSMDMFLSFSPTAGGSVLRFFFSDLDLIGVNDPRGFLENIAIYNQDMTTQIAFVDSASDPEVIAANRSNQELLVSLASVMPLGDPFIARLRFGAGPVAGWNTAETIKAELVQVPEPTSLLIFGIGLLGAGVFSTKRRNSTA